MRRGIALLGLALGACDCGARVHENQPKLDGLTDISFGQAAIGYPRTHALTFHNLGAAPLTVDSITAARPFGVSPASVTLAPDEKRDIAVSYDPTVAKQGSDLDVGTLTVTSDDPDHPTMTAHLDGQGVAASV